MAENIPGFNKTFSAGADLSAAQYRCVVDLTSETVTRVATQGARVRGILQNKPSASGQAASVMLLGAGSSKVVYGGTVSVGDALISDNQGRAIRAVTELDDHVIGTAILAGVSGDVGEAHIACPCRYEAGA